MAKEIRLPKFGDSMKEGTVVACKVGVGDHVKSGDVLLEIETDKATVEIESPQDGYVKYIFVKLGQSCEVEAPLLVIGEKDEQVSDEFITSLETEDREQKAEDRINRTMISPQSSMAGYPSCAGRRIPATRFQKLTAQKMLRSKQEIPCFYLNVRADVTELVACRATMNETGPDKIAYNDFVIKAVAMGLERFPIMTGQLDGDSIRLASAIGVGLAIAVPDGLVAPVVKDADKKTIAAIAHCTKQLAKKAGDNELSIEDLEGGCITVSNLGSYGIDSFIPIVVPGQCSILGIGRIKDVCVPDDGNINIRKIMNMTLSVDHKVANGAYAAQFLDFVKKILETPNELK